MKRFLSVLLVVFSIVIAGHASAVVVAPWQDANIAGGTMLGQPTPDFGYLTYRSGEGNPNAGLLQFDVSSLAPGVSSAYVNVYQEDGPTAAAAFAIYRVTSEWYSGSATWDSVTADMATPFGLLTIPADDGGVWRSFDVTGLVNGWLSGSYANYGMMLARADLGNADVYFQSSTNTYAPSLNAAPVPVPPSLLLLLPGLVGVVGLRRKRNSN